MYWCQSCEYKSKRKSNLQKHITNVHKRDATDEELMPNKNTTEPLQNPSLLMPKTDVIIQETVLENTKNLTCLKCSKNFKTFQSLKMHQDICKGVSNPLECHYCHNIFATAQSKSKHLKICKIKKAETNHQNDQSSHYSDNNIDFDLGKEDTSYIDSDQIYSNIMSEIFQGTLEENFQNLLKNVLNDHLSTENISEWQEYEDNSKKILYSYLDKEVEEVMKRKKFDMYMKSMANSR
jgi:hypothetical protein